MEAAKKLQLHFIGLQREDRPTKAETLRKVIYDGSLSGWCYFVYITILIIPQVLQAL